MSKINNTLIDNEEDLDIVIPRIITETNEIVV